MAVEANRDRLTGRGDLEVFYRDYKFDFATPHAVAIALANFGIKLLVSRRLVYEAPGGALGIGSVATGAQGPARVGLNEAAIACLR